VVASVSWHELAEPDVDYLLTSRVSAWLQTPFPDEISTLTSSGKTTGFDMGGLDAALGIPWELDKNDIGEAFAAAVLEVHAGCHFPALPFWDHRDPKVRPGGTDLVGYRGNGATCRFAFAEAKTSEDSKSPPMVVAFGDHCLVRQLERLRDVKRKRDTLVRYLQAKLTAQSAARFQSAMSAYLQENSNVHILGALLRPGPKQVSDLTAAAKKLASVSAPHATIELHGIVINGGLSVLANFAAALQGRAS
jgi:hypothetical protein